MRSRKVPYLQRCRRPPARPRPSRPRSSTPAGAGGAPADGTPTLAAPTLTTTPLPLPPPPAPPALATAPPLPPHNHLTLQAAAQCCRRRRVRRSHPPHLWRPLWAPPSLLRLPHASSHCWAAACWASMRWTSCLRSQPHARPGAPGRRPTGRMHKVAQGSADERRGRVRQMCRSIAGRGSCIGYNTEGWAVWDILGRGGGRGG